MNVIVTATYQVSFTWYLTIKNLSLDLSFDFLAYLSSTFILRWKLSVVNYQVRLMGDIIQRRVQLHFLQYEIFGLVKYP